MARDVVGFTLMWGLGIMSALAYLFVASDNYAKRKGQIYNQAEKIAISI